LKILVIGASGLVGWNLRSVAQQSGHTVTGTHHRHSLPGLLPLSLDDFDSVAALLKAETSDVVACCAAWSWVDGCESDRPRAFRENAEFPGKAARAAMKTGARFIYYSTSYVFDGEHGPYREEDKPNPISVYAESKLEGEKAVLDATNGNALIIRTMGVYGEEPQKKNFVYQVVRNLSAANVMQVARDQFGNATGAANLADGTLRLIDRNLSGIWNLAGPDPNLNRAVFARAIARSYDLDEGLIEDVTTPQLNQAARRPKQAGLIVTKAIEAIRWEPAPWKAFPIFTC
jgi:dTDP-4-dehydrorhamnose reductase